MTLGLAVLNCPKRPSPWIYMGLHCWETCLFWKLRWHRGKIIYLLVNPLCRDGERNKRRVGVWHR